MNRLPHGRGSVVLAIFVLSRARQQAECRCANAPA